ncbi:MAG: hypothetical protein IH886_00250, partial [Nitrospinae bacterium]|nr:hypothetical protein [Nitrospinota bacterium]
EIGPQGVQIHRQQTDLVDPMEDDVFRVAFNPLYEVPRIRTLTEDSGQRQKEKAAVTRFIEDGPFLDKLAQTEVMEAFRHWGIGYRLEVFDKDQSEVWSIDFNRAPTVQKGYFGRVHLYEGIGYSEFYRLIQGETNWDFVGASGQYRTFHNVYRVDREKFECYPQEKKFPQPLAEVFPANREMNREKYMKDVRRWKGQFDQAGPAKMIDNN